MSFPLIHSLLFCARDSRLTFLNHYFSSLHLKESELVWIYQFIVSERENKSAFLSHSFTIIMLKRLNQFSLTIVSVHHVWKSLISSFVVSRISRVGLFPPPLFIFTRIPRLFCHVLFTIGPVAGLALLLTFQARLCQGTN